MMSPALHLVADLHQRPLVDAGVLVRALELQQVVDVDAGRVARRLLGGADDDAGRVDLVDHAARARATIGDAGVAGDRAPPCRCRRAAPPTGCSGTAWRCMFEPMSARLASSFSRNGMSAAATETSCFGDTSMKSMSSGRAMTKSPPRRQLTRSSAKRPFLSSAALAWAIDVLALLHGRQIRRPRRSPCRSRPSGTGSR